MARLWIALGAASGFLAVAAGALVRHGGDASGALAAANLFHLVHALALVGVGLAARSFGRSRWLDAAGAAFAAGTLLFSGAIYAVHALGWDVLRPATPLGGIAFMAGWLALAAAVIRAPRS